MFKNLSCLLVRWHFDPKARRPTRFARHISSCAACRDFFESTQALEDDLRQPAFTADPALCEAIMQEVRALPSRAVPHAPVPFLRRPSFALAAAVVTGCFGFWVFWPQESGVSEPLAGQPDPPVLPPAENVIKDEELPGARTIRSVASLLEQQELLRRDAKKLGSHLRERVILFQSTD